MLRVPSILGTTLGGNLLTVRPMAISVLTSEGRLGKRSGFGSVWRKRKGDELDRGTEQAVFPGARLVIV